MQRPRHLILRLATVDSRIAINNGFVSLLVGHASDAAKETSRKLETYWPGIRPRIILNALRARRCGAEATEG